MKLSLIIPTYNEKDNIEKLISIVDAELTAKNIEHEIIVVDDGSPDGTGNVLDRIAKKNEKIRVVHRTEKLGLSSAVLAGFDIASGDVLGVMDADLSHPVDTLSTMYQEIIAGTDIVIGSRYIRGGMILGWGPYRKVLSKGGTLLARVFTHVKDPLSGYFLIRKKTINGKVLNPLGFKLLLEILVKADYKDVVEVPITFTDRTKGKSKAGANEIFYFLKNVYGYIPYKKDVLIQFFKFCIVGLLGTFINLAITYYLTEDQGVYYILSAMFGFIVAVSSNFIFNKIWTFKQSLREKIVITYFHFILVSLGALAVNISLLYVFTEVFGIYYLASQIIAIGIALVVNFFGNKTWTFQK